MPENEAPKPKPKRTTVASLKKDLQEVEQIIDENILEELAAHEVRIEALEKGFLADAPPVWGEIDKRITALENATGALADAVRKIAAGVADWGTRMEAAEDSIRSLIGRREYTQESAEPPGLDFVVSKTPETSDRLYPSELKAVAQVAQTMSDVLMLTRVLKADKNFSDDERRKIMSIACKAAGVPYSENLLVRAGVQRFYP